MGKGRVLKTYDSRAVFENLDTGACLVVTQIKEGWSRDIQVCERAQLADIGGQYHTLSIEAIFGFYDLLSGPYVAVVVESEKFVDCNGIELRKAIKIVVVPLFRNGRLLSESKQRDETKYLQLLQSAFNMHQFFYSYTYDVTSTQQRLSKLTSKLQAEPIWTRANAKYFWNRDVVLDMIACRADDWIVPFMSGYVEFRPGCEIENDKFVLLFVSRRSRMRQGCRFTKRGVDEQGYVANYIETEQILIFPDGRVASHVQIRGSIPLCWSSPVHMKYDPKVFISDERSKSAQWCERHVKDIVHDCSNSSGTCEIVFINLIDGKRDQGKLAVEFKAVIDMVQQVSTVEMQYVWFDFHHECRLKGKWNNISKLVNQLDHVFASQSFFSKLGNGEVLSWQSGVFRTNCMDNLDRTNVVQSVFARRAILMQLGRKDLLKSEKVLEMPFKKFESIYKTVWVNHANEMSVLYAGTGALKVDFTKTGKRTLVGMYNDGVNSCMRYYINNFLDGEKQDAIDLMVGNYHPDPSSPSPFILPEGKESLHENLNKAFILCVLIFTGLLLVSPTLIRPVATNDSNLLTTNLLVSLLITFTIVVYVGYIVVKRGSKIGERLVSHPRFVPDPVLRRSASG